MLKIYVENMNMDICLKIGKLMNNGWKKMEETIKHEQKWQYNENVNSQQYQ